MSYHQQAIEDEVKDRQDSAIMEVRRRAAHEINERIARCGSMLGVLETYDFMDEFRAAMAKGLRFGYNILLAKHRSLVS